MRSLLRDPEFKMDDQRQYLVFDNAVYDKVNDEWIAHAPQIRSSHTTGWSWYGSGLNAAEERLAKDAVVSCDERMLTGVTGFIPALAFLYDITGAWERCIYLCKHMARAVFAMELQEILWTRGPGSNAKDTLANLMQSLLGQYFANLPCEALTSTREMDTPSQTMLGLKGKRFVAVREVAKNARIRSHVYKTISNPKATLKPAKILNSNHISCSILLAMSHLISMTALEGRPGEHGYWTFHFALLSAQSLQMRNKEIQQWSRDFLHGEPRCSSFFGWFFSC